jgi:hypothetical protein
VIIGYFSEGKVMKMKKSIEKIVLCLLVTLLLSSTAFVMLGQAQDIGPTTASLFIAPNPVGTGQKVSGIALIQPSPSTNSYCFVSIAAPDGATNNIDLYTDNMGVARFDFTPNKIGDHTLVLHFPVGEFDEIESPPVVLVVQEMPVPPGVPVLPGDDVTVHPDPNEPRISLHFEHITSSGTATVSETAAPPSGVSPLPRIIGLYYDFDVTFTFTGPVTVGLPYAERLANEQRLSMWHYEGGLVGDVNRDGKVDCRDIRLIKFALGTTPRMRRWNPACDLNGDKRVNYSDLCIALRNYGGNTRTWVDVTSYVDTVNNIVYGSTSNFPPFGIRYR